MNPDLDLSLHETSPTLGALKVFAMSQSDRVGVNIQKGSFDDFLHSSSRQTIVAASWKRVAGDWHGRNGSAETE